MNARVRYAVGVIAGIGISFGCETCEPDPAKCEPCDAVAILRMAQVDGDVAWEIPPEAEAACPADFVIPARMLSNWESRACPDLTAHYTVTWIDWTRAEEEWEEKADHTYICSQSSFEAAGGCAEAPSDGGTVLDHQLVGPIEVEDIPAEEGLVPEESAGSTDSSTSSGGDIPEDPYVIAANAVAMFVKTDLIDSANIENLGEPFDVSTGCPPAVLSGSGVCTAFLIGPRHVLTARHCIDYKTICPQVPYELADRSLLFDYANPLLPTEALEVTDLTAIACAEGSEVPEANDWLLIEMPEPVDDRPPIPLPEASRRPQVCESIFSIAHPLGHWRSLVGKREDAEPSAWVTSEFDAAGEPSTGPIFETTIDAILNMSGAPIFDLQNNLVGLHTRGTYRADAPSGVEDCVHCPEWGCDEHGDYGKAIVLADVSEELRALISE